MSRVKPGRSTEFVWSLDIVQWRETAKIPCSVPCFMRCSAVCCSTKGVRRLPLSRPPKEAERTEITNNVQVHGRRKRLLGVCQIEKICATHRAGSTANHLPRASRQPVYGACAPHCALERCACACRLSRPYTVAIILSHYNRSYTVVSC